LVKVVREWMRWRCHICGFDVIEGQRFGYLPGKGFIHIECLYDKLKELFPDGIPEDVLAAVEAEEIASYGIIRIKQVEYMVGDEYRDEVVRIRKKFEGASADAGKLIHKLLERYNVSIK